MPRTLSLIDVMELADLALTGPDLRPSSLRALRDAEHPTCPYYRFLFALGGAQTPAAWPHLGPFLAIEVGTYCGTSAAHLAAGGGHVVTIDINPDAARQVEMHLGGLAVEAVTGDSREVLHRLVQTQAPVCDVAFIDGLHDFEHAYREYRLARQLVCNGGLIIFDDAGLEMDGDEMEVTWDLIADPKIRIDDLHPNVGFGVVIKDERIELSPVEDVAGDALGLIKANRARRAGA
jgi:hypothetical protein